MARAVQIPSVDQEDAKRIERERKYLAEKRISIIGRIKGLLALHGIWLDKENIGKGLRQRLDAMKTGDGRLLAPFLRSEIERMLTRHDLISQQIADVEADRKAALNNEKGVFPHADKVRRSTTLGAVGETTALIVDCEATAGPLPHLGCASWESWASRAIAPYGNLLGCRLESLRS
jgi:transposase